MNHVTRKLRKLQVLMIGPLPPPLGGACLLFENLINELGERDDVQLSLINLSRQERANDWLLNLKYAVKITITVLYMGREVDVISFHANHRGRLLFGPIMYLLAKLLGKPIIMRAFGGGFDQQYLSSPWWLRWILRRTYFQAELCLLETKHLVEYFSQTLGIRRAEWFSNYAPAIFGVSTLPQYKTSCQRFIFIGRLIPEKGIDVILDAVDHLDAGIDIELFGPLGDCYTAHDIDERGRGKVRYKGVLDREQVSIVLRDHDALVLPTFWPGEGYPAVILEAYSSGLPVIATRWMSIPEIVDESAGLLVEPNDVTSFARAVNLLSSDNALFSRLKKGTHSKSQQFTSAYWTQCFVDYCQQLTTSETTQAQ